MQTKVHFNKLKLKNPFGIHHGNYNYRYHIIVEIVASPYSGFGETVAIDYYGISIEQLIDQSDFIQKHIKTLSTDINHVEFYNILTEICPHSPFIRCAFDQAFLDLKSKISQQNLTDYLQLPPAKNTTSSVTIGLSDSPELIEKLINEPWPFYKLKVNNALPYELIEKLNNKGKSWGIDANGSFSLGQAQNILSEVENLSGVYAEQLCPKNADWSSLSKNMSTIPHLADESITDMASAKKLSAHCDGFVLKLTKCGGITPALELIKYAKSENKILLAGCMTESSIGINHMLSLASQFDYFDLDGAYLISNDHEVAHSLQDNLLELNNDGTFS